MSSKKKSSNKKATVTTTTVKKERTPRKPPLERAVRLAGSLIKSRGALAKNVKRWAGEATREQRLAITRIINEMKKFDEASDQIAGSLAFLVETKYAPKVEHLGGRTKSYGVGASVQLKEKRYDVEIHGVINAYTVTGETARGYYLLKSTCKPVTTLGVPRSWLEKREDAAVPAAVSAVPKGAAPAPMIEPSMDNDIDENPDLDTAGE